MEPKIDIKDTDRKAVAEVLNFLLADEYVLYTKTRNAHWNVQGPNFIELHKFFESQFGTLDEIIDQVAERVRSIGHFSLGGLKDFLEVTRISEDMHKFSDSKQMIQSLLADHETIICNIRKEIGTVGDKHKDLGTADFITGILKQHETMAWMLRAHIS